MTDPEPTHISTFGSNRALNLGLEIWDGDIENGWFREIENISASDSFHELETAKHDEPMRFSVSNCEVGVDTALRVNEIVRERWVVYTWQEI